MRTLTVKVPAGKGQEVKNKAEKLKGKNLSIEQLDTGELVRVHLNNNTVDSFIRSIDNIEEAEITLNPRGVISLYPPQDEAPDQVTDVTFRSPFEIFLGGLQSVGSKFGLMGYAASGGVLVWIGLYTNTTFLLVAAMLVSPFAGPAMNAALAAAAGKSGLLLQSLKRYAMAIGLSILVSFILSYVFKQQHATSLMVDISHISQMTILLPLVAGFAGGINLVQSERDSLVPGAAVGVLVAASLAPPTGLIGMALNFGNWQMVQSGLFLLILQLAGIQLSAALVFRYLGRVTIKGARFADGKENVFRISLLVSVAVLGGLMYWQFNKQPNLQKGSISTQITQTIRNTLKEVEYVETIEVNSRFTRGTLPNLNPVICELYLYNRSDSLSDEQVKQALQSVLFDRIKDEKWNADPMFDITMLDYKGEKPQKSP
ncbi:putative hydrophobic protein (TIGR00271 family) [Pontibacter aydingkolensis]|uniref:DUF389 domain-containing protein n=1 Tax=Pontibacter aydingkolensis TaxID=1911536 RepID=A0ABS7CYP3_9BACT|nr:DUF389 domain-containing protein [Pontibacter aydingkolensis]MBW7468978.1 DUF389 domain-containing protein [Pontibacter aydingkolensis]